MHQRPALRRSAIRFCAALLIVTWPAALLVALPAIAEAQPMCGSPEPTAASPIGLFPSPAMSMVTFAPAPGSSPELWAFGTFTSAGGLPVQHAARWNGVEWRPAIGVPPGFTALGVADLGQGPELLGRTDGATLLRTSGTTWSAVPIPQHQGVSGHLSALAVPDQQSPGWLGGSVCIGVNYSIWPSRATGIVYGFDGQQWTQLGDEPPHPVGGLAVYDPDGPGPRQPEVYASGAYWVQVSSSRYETYNVMSVLRESTWVTISRHVSDYEHFGPFVVHESPLLGRPILIVGGDFYRVGMPGSSVAAWNVAAWDGEQWSAMGDGLPSRVDDFAKHPVAGQMQLIASAGGLFRLDGHEWRPSATIQGSSPILIEEFGESLAVSGEITMIGGFPIDRFALLTDGHWSGITNRPAGWITAMGVFNDGPGRRLFAAGGFLRVGEVQAQRLARWNGTRWEALPGGLEPLASTPQPIVRDMLVFNDGGGWALYIAGNFGRVGGVNANNIARYDGTSWAAVGDLDGNGGGLRGGTVWALQAHDPDGSGPLPRALYAAGEFTTTASGATARRIAKWNGHSWMEVGGGSTGNIFALRSWDDSQGPALYTGGEEHAVAGLPPNLAFKLVGEQWMPLPPLATSPHQRVRALAIFESGGHPRLHAVGRFAPVPTHGFRTLLVRLDEAAWTDIAIGRGEALTARRLPHGNEGRLLVGTTEGLFEHTGQAALSAIDVGTSGAVRALSPPYDDGAGAAVFVGGQLHNIFRIAVCPPSPCYANCDGSSAPPILNIDDFICFIDRFAAGDPYANCDQSTTPPVLNVDDFTCFITQFAAGCE